MKKDMGMNLSRIRISTVLLNIIQRINADSCIFQVGRYLMIDAQKEVLKLIGKMNIK